MMTKARLQEIKRRYETAKLGPWRAKLHHNVWFVEYGPENDLSECFDLMEDPSPETAAFVAASITDIPDLIAEVERFWKWLQFAREYQVRKRNP